MPRWLRGGVYEVIGVVILIGITIALGFMLAQRAWNATRRASSSLMMVEILPDTGVYNCSGVYVLKIHYTNNGTQSYEAYSIELRGYGLFRIREVAEWINVTSNGRCVAVGPVERANGLLLKLGMHTAYVVVPASIGERLVPGSLVMMRMYMLSGLMVVGPVEVYG